MIRKSCGSNRKVRQFCRTYTAHSEKPRGVRKCYRLLVTILGPLAGEPPEPMTKEQFEAARKRLRSTLSGIVSIDKPDLERLIAEIVWLKRRLHRVEDAIAPIVNDLRRGE